MALLKSTTLGAKAAGVVTVGGRRPQAEAFGDRLEHSRSSQRASLDCLVDYGSVKLRTL